MHRGVPHILSTHYPLVPAPGYGFFGSKGFPQIAKGASDDAANGAVLWVARKLLGDGVSAYPVFDAELDRAVRGFQQAQGLAVDGVVGPDTYRALGYTGKVETASSGPSVPLTRRAWFLPTAILVGALAIGAAIVLWPRRGEYAARAKAWRKK